MLLRWPRDFADCLNHLGGERAKAISLTNKSVHRHSCSDSRRHRLGRLDGARSKDRGEKRGAIRDAVQDGELAFGVVLVFFGVASGGSKSFLNERGLLRIDASSCRIADID